jgi:hypothetical protein
MCFKKNNLEVNSLNETLVLFSSSTWMAL